MFWYQDLGGGILIPVCFLKSADLWCVRRVRTSDQFTQLSAVAFKPTYKSVHSPMSEDFMFSSSVGDDATDISRSKRQEHLWISYWNDHLLLKRGKVSYAKDDIETNLGGNWKRSRESCCYLLHLAAIFRAPCGLLSSVWPWINLYIPQSPQRPLTIWQWQRDGPRQLSKANGADE